VTAKIVPPSVTETAFTCPHCGALTTQHWSDVYGSPITDEPRTPSIPDKGAKEHIIADVKLPRETKQALIEYISKMESGEPFAKRHESSSYLNNQIDNLFLSECYNCRRFAVWVNDKLIFPPQRVGPAPNADLPEDIARDYEEARSILSLSPRGAAALLRLCVQKLCIFLGEKGKNIDDDIASLVAKGLNPLVQRSLDIVRVIGNEAVHPGVIDLNDDRDTANQLFDLVNAIADQMISHPKRVSAMYEKLPKGKREAIERRNAKATTKTPEGA